jgi:hypothetical protein
MKKCPLQNLKEIAIFETAQEIRFFPKIGFLNWFETHHFSINIEWLRWVSFHSTHPTY